MLGAYTGSSEARPNIGTGIIMPVNNPIEPPNKQVEGRTDVLGIFPNEDSIIRLLGSVLFGQKDECYSTCRYGMAGAFAQFGSEEIGRIPNRCTKVAWPCPRAIPEITPPGLTQLS